MIVKHVSSKSSSYSATQDYMEKEHDEKTGKVVKDEQGHDLQREFICDVANVQSKETWASECAAANRNYNTNKTKGEVKQHQYILSFSKEEVESNNLTPEKVIEIGKEWLEKTMPEHQSILYVHNDGHNGSGNMHVHVNINSVRIQSSERQDWMNNQKKYFEEGMKHTCTAPYRHFMIQSLDQICKKRGYEMEVQKRTDKHITDKEYWVNKKGKEQNPEFDTQKEELRQCIRATIPQCMIRTSSGDALDEDLYKKTMEKDYGITVTESRGRFSYMHPEWKRKKPVSDKKLGESYRKENIIHGISEQIDRADSERDNIESRAWEQLREVGGATDGNNREFEVRERELADTSDQITQLEQNERLEQARERADSLKKSERKAEHFHQGFSR